MLPGKRYGKLITADLTNGKSYISDIPTRYLYEYIGGRGLGARLLWDYLPKGGINPFSPDNPLLIMPGPFSGLPVPSSTRTTIVTKSPHRVKTDDPSFHRSTISYSNMGGYIGPAIRKAGFEGLAITGQCQTLSYLVIDDGAVTIIPSPYLAGKSTEETRVILENELGDGFRLCYTGQAGENHSPLATIMTTGSSAAGRGGTGGIMGYKNLKAIAIRGSYEPTITDHDSYSKLLQSLPSTDKQSLDGALLNPCILCNLDCRKGGYSKITTRKKGSDSGHSISKMMGRIMRSDNRELLDEMVDIADNYGADIISSAANFASLLHSSPNNGIPGVISDDYRSLLLEQYKAIILGDASNEIFQASGSKGDGLTPRIKGHEYAQFRPLEEISRWAVSYATSNRGSCHISGNTPERQDENALIDSIGACSYARGLFGSELKYPEFLKAIIGESYTEETLIETGRRIFTLEKMFNLREGFTREDDEIPGYHELGPILDDYYIKREWDPKTSRPHHHILLKLGLEFTL